MHAPALHDVLGLLRKHLISLLLLPLAFGLAGLYLALAKTPVYRATAWLQVDPNPVKTVAEINEMYDPGYGSYQYYVTQSLILTSRKLAIRLIERLQLMDSPEFGRVGPPLSHKLQGALSRLPLMPPAPPPFSISEEERLERVISRVQKATHVELAPSSTLFKVHFESEDPKLAAAAANALADLYIEELLDARLDIYRKATQWLTEKLGNISGSLESAESALQAFRDQQDIVNVGGTRGLAEEELRDLSKRLRQAQKETTALASIDREVRQVGDNPSALASISGLLIDPVIKEVTENYLAEQKKLRSLEQRYGARHPQMATARASLENAKRAYFEQLGNKANSIRSEYNIALRNQQQLERQVARVRARLKDLDRKQFELSQMEREVASNQQLYDLFLSRYKETQSNSTSAEVNARVIDEAFPPNKAFKPNILRTVMIGVILGLFGAIASLLLRVLLNVRVESVEELEQLIQSPIVGVIPRVKKPRALQQAAHYLADEPKSPFAESIRSIRTAITLNGSEQDLKVLAISSTEPGEGKTTLSSALASALASNAKVLLIDTDMRRARAYRQFGISRQHNNQQGLSAVLNGQCAMSDALIQDEKTQVDLLPAGMTPANPAMLLDSDTFTELVSQAREHYRYIIIDTPPLGASSDALHLAPNIDAFMLITRLGVTNKRGLNALIKQLKVINAPVFGFIANGVTASHQGNYYSYYGYQ